MLDKQLNLLLKFSRGGNLKKIHDLPLEEVRKNAEDIAIQMGTLPVESVTSRDYTIKTKDQYALPLRIYNAGETKKPIIVFYHGGGYTVYNIKTHDSFCRFLASSLDVVVVSIEYRRAPEYKYPTAFDDSLFSTLWAINNHTLFNGDAENVILCGDSVGGSLTLQVNNALYKEKVIKGLVLLYPVITFKRHYASYEKYGKGYFLDTDTMDWFKEMCTTNEHDLDYDLQIESLTLNKPFIYLAISEYDVLRDEAIEFKEQLESVKAYVQYRIFETMPHNFILMAGKVKGAKKAIETICLDLKEMI